MSVRAWADACWACGSPLPDNRKCGGNDDAGRQGSGSGGDSREAGESIKNQAGLGKSHKNGGQDSMGCVCASTAECAGLGCPMAWSKRKGRGKARVRARARAMARARVRARVRVGVGVGVG